MIMTYIVIYVLGTIAYMIKTIYDLEVKAKLFYEQKEILENLAVSYGYSRAGWERFQQYQEFAYENKEVFEVYEAYRSNPLGYGFTTLLVGFILWPVAFVYFVIDRLKKARG